MCAPMPVKRENGSTGEITAVGYDGLREILERIHLYIKRGQRMAYSRHILAFMRYHAIVVSGDNVGQGQWRENSCRKAD